MTPLRRRMLEDMQIRNLSAGTQAIYLAQVSQFARYFGKPPDVLGEQEIRAYQLHLTQEKKLAPSTITVAVSALRFLYQVTLRRRWNFEDIIPAPKTPDKLPVILSPEEVSEFLVCVSAGKHRTLLTTCYAAGLRLSEAIHLLAGILKSCEKIRVCRVFFVWCCLPAKGNFAGLAVSVLSVCSDHHLSRSNPEVL